MWGTRTFRKCLPQEVKKLAEPVAPTTEGCGQVIARVGSELGATSTDLAVENLRTAQQAAYRVLFCSLSEDQLPLINIVLANKPVQALIDLGASGCIIDLDMCRQLPNIIIDTSRAIRMEQVAGDAMAYGSTLINLKWAGGWNLQSVLVVPCANRQVILGRDFLRGAAIVPDVEKGVWTSRKLPGIVTPFEAPVRIFSVRIIEMADWRWKVDRSDCMVNYKADLLGLLEKNLGLFEFKPGGAIGVCHQIRTIDHAPVCSAFRPENAAKRKFVAEHLAEYLRCGAIERSCSAWRSSPVAVPKPDESSRFCVDFRKVNEITIPDSYPMQNIEDILSRLGKANWFTTIDLEKGFFQIPLAPDDREKTAFSTHQGLFQFTVMPFGLRNAPATFQRFMDGVLGDAARKWAEPFFADIIIYSETLG